MPTMNWIELTAIVGLALCLCLITLRFCMHVERSRAQDMTHSWELLQLVERVTERYTHDFSLAQKHSLERSSNKSKESPIPPMMISPDSNPLFAGMDDGSPNGKDWSPPNV